MDCRNKLGWCKQTGQLSGQRVEKPTQGNQHVASGLVFLSVRPLAPLPQLKGLGSQTRLPQEKDYEPVVWRHLFLALITEHIPTWSQHWKEDTAYVAYHGIHIRLIA